MSIRVTVTGGLRARAEAAAQKASEIVMKELAAAFDQSFAAKAWTWPRDLPTRKLNGDTVSKKAASYRRGEGLRAGNPRNLIDVGNLRQSASYRMTGPYQATFKWSAPYATFVHEGGYIWAWGRRPPLKGARAVYAPPRPWTRAVLGQENVSGIRTYDVGDRLKNVWLVQLKKAQGS
jgi:hypothetical protein